MSLAPRKAALLVAAVAFLGYLPVLDGEFLDLDDDRFVRDNPAVHRLGLKQAVRFFTDPSTLGIWGWQGTNRPLRTLDFSIDWAVSGGRPWFFHLRNVLYHVLGSLLVLAIFRRLSGEAGKEEPAVFGALLFAVHPVHTECVAWVTSRGDVLLLVTFLSALLLHVSGRRIAAALVLVVALLSKEAAVVFPAVAFLADRYRREPLRTRWYGLYAGIAGAYTLLWCLVQGEFGHRAGWWGGSYGDNLLSMSRGLVVYAGLIVLPVRQVLDYFVPMTYGLDSGALFGILLVLLAGVAVWRGNRNLRFAVLWFAVTLFPMLNLVYTVGAPTAERFLYLPMVGICLLGGHLLARSRLAFLPLACLFLLTFSRSWDWKDHDRLMAATRKVAATQVGQGHLAGLELQAANEALLRGDRPGLRRHARAVVRITSEFMDRFERRSGCRPSYSIVTMKWEGLFLLGRYEEALATAEDILAHGGGAPDHYYAGRSLNRLGRLEEAAGQMERAIEAGYRDYDLRPTAVQLLRASAARRTEAGEREAARALRDRALRLLPDWSREAGAFAEGQLEFAARELDAAHDARARGDRWGLIRHGQAVVRAADDLVESFPSHRCRLLTGLILVKKSNALFILGRYEEALTAAEASLPLGGGAYAHHNAWISLDRLQRHEEAALHLECAIGAGFDEYDLRPSGARLLNAAAGKREAAGQKAAARRLYLRSVRLFPDRRANAEAWEGLRRIER